MTISVPSQYQEQVKDAAFELGIPEQVVAAQLQLESNWNPAARSSAGAEGLAQFLPGTFQEYGPKGGDPFNASDAFYAYVHYMAALLKRENNDLRKALAAYNAGPGNLSAGAGYASTILSRAGLSGNPSSTGTEIPQNAGPTPTVTDGGGNGLLSWPGEIVGFFKSGLDDLGKAASFFSAFFQVSTYVRIGAGVLGAVFLVAGIVCLGIEVF